MESNKRSEQRPRNYVKLEPFRGLQSGRPALIGGRQNWRVSIISYIEITQRMVLAGWSARWTRKIPHTQIFIGTVNAVRSIYNHPKFAVYAQIYT